MTKILSGYTNHTVLFVIQKNKKTMIKEKGKEICQRVLDTNMLFQDIEAQFILW